MLILLKKNNHTNRNQEVKIINLQVTAEKIKLLHLSVDNEVSSSQYPKTLKLH